MTTPVPHVATILSHQCRLHRPTLQASSAYAIVVVHPSSARPSSLLTSSGRSSPCSLPSLFLAVILAVASFPSYVRAQNYDLADDKTMFQLGLTPVTASGWPIVILFDKYESYEPNLWMYPHLSSSHGQLRGRFAMPDLTQETQTIDVTFTGTLSWDDSKSGSDRSPCDTACEATSGSNSFSITAPVFYTRRADWSPYPPADPTSPPTYITVIPGNYVYAQLLRSVRCQNVLPCDVIGPITFTTERGLGPSFLHNLDCMLRLAVASLQCSRAASETC
jgi:hypothetical protein